METTIIETLQVVPAEEISESLSVTSSSSQSRGSDVSIPVRSAEVAKDTRHLALSSQGDINTAAALRAQYAIQIPKTPRRRRKKMPQPPTSTTNPPTTVNTDSEPILDTTTTLPLHSKKTERLQRKAAKKSLATLTSQSQKTTILSLPSELLTEIFTHLLPTDIPSLLLTSRIVNTLVTYNESQIAKSIIRRRYWTLHRCFPVPIPFASVPADAHAALLSPKRQEMLNIHRKSYHQHVQMVDPTEMCTCMTCVFAWNNLCLVVDLHHWQPHLENRTPLPIIARGAEPSWNTFLLGRNADLVRLAVKREIVYARILMMHLETTTRTIQRNARWRKASPLAPIISPSPSTSTSTPSTTPPSSFAPSRPRLYHLSDTDVARGTDEFLDRSGPPSYDFPFMRDNYYSLEAYLPNRKWSTESASWHYYGLAPLQHERDLEWVRSWARGAGWRG